MCFAVLALIAVGAVLMMGCSPKKQVNNKLAMYKSPVFDLLEVNQVQHFSIYCVRGELEAGFEWIPNPGKWKILGNEQQIGECVQMILERNGIERRAREREEERRRKLCTPKNPCRLIYR